MNKKYIMMPVIVIIGMFMGITVLLPIQILFIDLFTDAILSICMAFESAGKNIMNVPPHKSRKFFTPFMTTFLFASAILECLLIFAVYLIGHDHFGYEVAQSMAFLCLIVQEMVFAYNCRNLHEPIVKHGLFSNKVMNIGMIFLILIQFLIFLTPVRKILHIVPIGMGGLLIIIILNIFIFLILELMKPFLSRRFQD